MNKSLIKDTLRNITKSIGRFISILLIIALGVAFFVGVKSSPLAMKETADVYYDDYHFMDIRLLSTLGFNEEDIEAIESVEGVEGVFPTNTIDVLTNYNAKELVMRIHALPLELLNSDDPNYINRVNVIEGRLPEKSGEAVVEKSTYNENITIGSTITLQSGNDTDLSDSLVTTEYTVVGFVETPYYLSFDKGTSSIGSGSVDSFIMIPQSDFTMDVYTEVYVTAEGATSLMTYDSEYQTLIDSLTLKLEDIGVERASIRYEEVITEARTELEKAKTEYEEKKATALLELEDAAKQIEEAKAELAEGKQALADGQATFNTKIAEAQNKIKEGEAALAKAEEELTKTYNDFLASKPQALEQIAAAEAELAKGEAELEQLS
ncbi:MAG TPA: ABC transporter permease, partial [Firmicutes bacterium]|nr:ABC transporter permease [Bacillota bacterium]